MYVAWERLGSLHLAAPPGDEPRAALVAGVDRVERDARPVMANLEMLTYADGAQRHFRLVKLSE
jgi:hypothetical protein